MKFERAMPDAACQRFISTLDSDFGRVATEKGRSGGTLEKWRIFPNRFLTLAKRCGELVPYDRIIAVDEEDDEFAHRPHVYFSSADDNP